MVLHSLMLGGLLLGVDVGWQPLPDGEGMEYLIQLSPKDLEAMKLGEPWMTDIPPSVGDVRAYRITVGSESLPRVAPPPSLPSEPSETAAEQPAPRPLELAPDTKPVPEQQAVYMTPQPGEAADAEKASEKPVEQTPPTSERPWGLLMGTALALAGSLGGNAYLFWALRAAYARCRELSEAAS